MRTKLTGRFFIGKERSCDLASELSAYASSEPILDSKTAGAASKDGKDAAPPADNKLTGPALLKFLEEDLPKDDHHHH
ncbi:hypothetical protein FRC20_003668 [Serendipita sp. 405]|nr:hypothetical protein FRC20_003668 [Serendipita sp. 405]